MRSTSAWSVVQRSNSRYCSIFLSISTQNWHMQSNRWLFCIRRRKGLISPGQEAATDAGLIKKDQSNIQKGESLIQCGVPIIKTYASTGQNRCLEKFGMDLPRGQSK
jgi:hypothetical protein